ncbi:aldehyde dehydrogenase family protein [Gulbenkiania mobilis]|uniref:Aldehyde dehydrogenase (NAD+) n=1 Tax=Gulbenkiania mobilis TaxID=397457 RepID=A0ABY2CYD6_GULMO|nr:aldehyde dehydrogenase (NAD+) [Gulbenkiania mobilis]
MHSNLIDGIWRNSQTALRNENPSDLDDVVGEYASGSPDDMREAVAAARAAFPAWSRTTPQQRSDILDTAGSEILARRQVLGTLLAREEGKTLPEAIGEVTRAGQIFKFFAGEALRMQGELMDSVRPGVEVLVSREAVGVVGLITPWNFPIAIPAWKTAPALAFGNTVVLKPAELVPGSAWALADILQRAGLPAGVFNLVMGSGHVLGPAMLDAGIDALSFTGSQRTGQSLAKACAVRGIKVQLEMGGKNPLVVADDADLEQAVECALNGAFYATGQRCTASSRLIVCNSIHDAFVTRLAERTAALRVGHALAVESQIGPVASEAQLANNLSHVAGGQAEGARLVYGGEHLKRTTRGYYQAPALFADCTPDMRLCREEIFGPVAAVLRAESYEHALALANDTPYGLAAGLCTRSLARATHFRRHAEAGMVMVNLPTAGVDYHVPFGGRKTSSHGPREQGRYAIEFYTTVKTAYLGS